MPRFTQEHEMLAQAVRDFVQREIVPFADEWERNHVCPPEMFRKWGEMGFIGATYPVEYGGGGMDLWAAAVIARELAMANVGGLQMSLFAHTYLPLPLLNAVGTEEQKQRYLVPAIRGEKIGGLGITEPGGGSDVGAMRTFAKDMGDHYVINGSKTYITNGTIADFIVLAAREGEGYDMTLFLFDTDTPGFSANSIDNKLGMHTSDTAELFFDNCVVPKSAVIGEPHFGFYYVMNNFQEERLIGALGGVYAAEYAYLKALQYAQERVTFGRPIAKHQVIRHKLAQMATRLEACRSICYRAVEEFTEDGPGAVNIISMAKAFVGEEIQRIIYDAVQIHGGNGFVEDYGVARVYRDMRLFSIGGGTTEIMYEIISKIVLEEAKHSKVLIKQR